MTTSVSELVEAGYTFTITDRDVSFDRDGELLGVEYHLSRHYYDNLDDGEETELIGMWGIEEAGESIDDYAHLDDIDRWSHDADAYMAQRWSSVGQMLRREPKGLDWGAMAWYKKQRELRWHRLTHLCLIHGKKLVEATKRRRWKEAKRHRRILSRIIDGVKQRYTISRNCCRDNKTWWGMYLTYWQKTAILSAAYGAFRACR